MVSIGNNVRIASGVTFLTHDIINGMFARDEELPLRLGEHTNYRFHMGTISVGDNVMIGSNTTILSGVKIGSRVIIGAGSIVTKDIPDGVIVAGNPAKVIGSYLELAKKRNNTNNPTNNEPIETIVNYYWGNVK